MLLLQIRPYYRKKVDRQAIIVAAEQAMSDNLPPNVTVGIVITGDAEIHALNRVYRQLDRSTDVLSFNQNVIDPETGMGYVGDIIISVPHASKQAVKENHTLTQEMELLVVHGMLHLAGFDHHTPADEKKMWISQAAILKKLGNPLADKFITG